MGWLMSVTSLALAYAVDASRLRNNVAFGKKIPDLAGLWFQRRTVLGMGILENRFFDIVKTEDGIFRAFPITACSAGNSWMKTPGTMRCDEDIVISVTRGDTSIATETQFVATKTTEGSTSVANLTGQKELIWSDGVTWELHTEAITLLDDWDDEECRALSGIAAAEPLEYEVYGGTSASLEFTNVPGVTIDMFACVHNDWLYKHQARFECVLRKASESKGGNNTNKQKMLSKALGKLREVMPTDEDSFCVPNVCIGIAVTKFPIPSPVPSISLFVTWPVNMDVCNGANIRDAIEDVKEQANSEATAVQQLQRSAFNGAHGSSISVFPVPNVAYFVMGTFHASRLFGGSIDTDKLLKEGRAAAAKIEALIADSIKVCPSIKERFQYHQLSDDVKASLSKSQSQGESLRIVAKSFPELTSMPANKGSHLGFGAGTYGQIGWLGVSAGVFGGGSFKAHALGKKYQGCSTWKEVIRVWYDSPLSELSPEQMQALAQPPPPEHARACQSFA